MERGGGAGDLLTTIRTVAETGSTNADMLALAARGLGEGVWLRAERQTAGRGRQGRAWQSPPGNLYASSLVRVRPGDPAPSGLALVAGVALAEALAALPFRLRAATRLIDGPIPDDPSLLPRPAQRGILLKWPNDVLLAGAKVAGILLERAEDTVVIGIGVNVAHHPEHLDRPVTSIAAHSVAVAPDALLEQIGYLLSHFVAVWRAEGLAPIRSRWLAFAHAPGTPLRAHLPDGSVAEGRFAGLDTGGALRLGLDDGSERIIHAGDVFAL